MTAHLLPHQQRVVDERQDNEERLGKLRQFLTTDLCFSLPFDERGRLVRQEKIMAELSEVLAERIEAF